MNSDNFINCYLNSPFFGKVKVSPDEREFESELDTLRRAPCYLERYRRYLGLICGVPDESGYAPWRPVDSPLDDRMIRRFEGYLSSTIPGLFKGYLQGKCLVDLNFEEVVLPEINPLEPLGWLAWVTDAIESYKQVIGERFIPFTYGIYHLGVLCFERSSDLVEDAPVFVAFRGSGSSMVERAFDSFSDYFQFAIDILEYRSSPDKGRFPHVKDWLANRGRKLPHNVYFDYENEFNNERAVGLE
jgi:hypothetical protein